MPRRDAAVPRTPLTGTKITVIFGVSSSQAYNLAVDKAQSFDTYEQVGSGKSLTHRVTFTLDQIEELRQMLDLVGRWKTTTLEVNGQPVLLKDVSPALQCYADSRRSYNPDEYCHGKEDASSYNDNDLGCRHCGVNPYGWQGLTEFGRMLKNGTFVVDKSKLIHTVTQNLLNYTICPRLNPAEIRRKLELFPNRIDPRVNREWEYVTDYNNGKEVAIGVRKRDPRRASGYVLRRDRDSLSSDMIITIDSNEVRDAVEGKAKKSRRKRKKIGCLLWILFAIGLVALIGALTGQPTT